MKKRKLRRRIAKLELDLMAASQPSVVTLMIDLGVTGGPGWLYVPIETRGVSPTPPVIDLPALGYKVIADPTGVRTGVQPADGPEPTGE